MNIRNKSLAGVRREARKLIAQLDDDQIVEMFPGPCPSASVNAILLRDTDISVKGRTVPNGGFSKTAWEKLYRKAKKLLNG